MRKQIILLCLIAVTLSSLVWYYLAIGEKAKDDSLQGQMAQATVVATELVEEANNDEAATTENEKRPEDIIARYQGRDDLTPEEIHALARAMTEAAPRRSRQEIRTELMQGPHATQIAREQEYFDALQKEIDAILAEDMGALLDRLPMANRDFAPPGLALRFAGGMYHGPGEDAQYGMKAYDLIFSNRRILRTLDLLESNPDPGLRKQIVNGMEASFEHYRNTLDTFEEGQIMPSLYSSEVPGDEPMSYASLLTALGLALVAAEHNITEAHPIILEMAQYGMEQRPQLEASRPGMDVNLYNRLILSQALAGTAAPGVAGPDLLDSLGVPYDYRTIGRGDTLFTPQEALHWKLPPMPDDPAPRSVPYVIQMDDETYAQLLQYFEEQRQS